MNAVRFHEHGGPDVLKIEECEDPRPGKGEALLEVKSCALNRLDLWVRQGIPAYPVSLPHILGSDLAGIVLEGDLRGTPQTFEIVGRAGQRARIDIGGDDARDATAHQQRGENA